MPAPWSWARAREKGAEIVPVDSEHSAIFQSLQGSSPKELRRILLTASGGPFFGWSREALEGVTPARALQHPNWSMGAKVTIDSATLMNKGLELLEAMSLFDVPPEKIQILIHRESILHSAVEYCDNSVIAQLGDPDMRLPIQYALSWPDRTPGPAGPWTCCRWESSPLPSRTWRPSAVWRWPSGGPGGGNGPRDSQRCQ